MSGLSVFTIEVTLCLSISWSISGYLRPVLSEVLEKLCESPLAARFWITFTHLMLLMFPLLLVLLYSHTAFLNLDHMAELLRNTLLRTLIGLTLGLVAVAANVWMFAVDTPRQPKTPAPGGH